MTDTNKTLSHWLITSDIDGTLNDKRRKLPQRNYDAIQTFVHELGGHFTLASGRSPSAMREQIKKINVPNSVVISLNGACIYDYAQEKMIWKLPLTQNNVDVAKKALNKYKFVSVQVITENYIHIYRADIACKIYANTQKMPIKKVKSLDEIKEPWLKLIMTGAPFFISALAKYVKSLSTTHENLMFTSPFSFDMVSEDTNKGKAVMKLADSLGIKQENTAAIGDYFNDYEMLKAVALPACCGQAPQGMKEISKLVTCHCNDGAVADLIEYIIKNYNN